jgi:hypothetical protein
LCCSVRLSSAGNPPPLAQPALNLHLSLPVRAAQAEDPEQVTRRALVKPAVALERLPDADALVQRFGIARGQMELFERPIESARAPDADLHAVVDAHGLKVKLTW